MDFDVRGSKGHVMTTFDKREEVFENKFAHDEELRFKAHARRNKLVGLWAAGKLGLAGEAAEAYGKAVVTADLDAPGSDGVFAKVRADFDAKSVAQSDHQNPPHHGGSHGPSRSRHPGRALDRIPVMPEHPRGRDSPGHGRPRTIVGRI